MNLPLANALLLHMATPDRRTVAQHCAALIKGGLPLARLVDDGLAPAMVQVGHLWASAIWTVADEHVATAVAEAGLSAAAAECHQPHVHGEVALACVEGDWHSLPARMVAEVLVAYGWSVRFLGASHPTDLLVEHLARYRPQAVLLSCSMPIALPMLMRAVHAVRGLDLPVYVGGRALGPDAARADAVGASGWAPNSLGAAELLGQRPAHAPARYVDERLAIYHDRRTLFPAWVDAAMTELADLMPIVSSYPPATRARTSADLLHLLDIACVALLLPDPTVLAEECTWLDRILVARGVDPNALDHGLAALCATRPQGEQAEAIDSALRGVQHHLG